MTNVDVKELFMPGNINLLQMAEPYVGFEQGKKVLSVACGTGELELYLADKFGCEVTGIDKRQDLVVRANKKTDARGLGHLVRFEEGDGNSLAFNSEAFDVVFCSGALYAFYEKGVPELYRVLKHGGKGASIELVWTRETIPPDVEQFWTEGTYVVLTLDGNRTAFQRAGFEVSFSAQFDNPRWWHVYYDAMGEAPEWKTEREHYIAEREFVALGLFVLEKK
jgi:ubiquinone/menaquinone biosynthesis C-methylase UbiE